MRVLEKSAMPVKSLVALLLPMCLGAQSPIPSLLVLTKEKVRTGKMVQYDTNESRIAATCARLRCPHPYLALKSISAQPATSQTQFGRNRPGETDSVFKEQVKQVPA